MKSFTERNPYILGAALVTVIALGTAMALLLNGGVFKSQYTLGANFSDAAGISSDAVVRAAGVQVGQVESVKAKDGTVRVTMKINNGIKVPDDSQAAIAVSTLLGTKYVKLIAGNDWAHVVKSGFVIPERRTSTPVELSQIQNSTTPLLQRTDKKALNDLLGQLADITKGKRANVHRILVGFDRLARVINARQGQARRLIDSARTLSQTLAARDHDLVATTDNLNVVIDTLVQRRQELAELLASTADASQRLANLVRRNRPDLDAILDEVHQDMVIISRHQMDLAQSLSLFGAAIKGFASIGYSGPNNVPNKNWGNVFAQLIGPLDQDAVFGSCGVIDRVLTGILGPDPVEQNGNDCSAATGPIPGQSSTQSSGPGANFVGDLDHGSSLGTVLQSLAAAS